MVSTPLTSDDFLFTFNDLWLNKEFAPITDPTIAGGRAVRVDDRVLVAGTAVHTLKEGQISSWRGLNIGVVFQFFQLLPTLTVLENVMLPMDFCNMYARSERKERALHLLEQVDLTDQAYKLPSSLSGGQQQRVAGVVEHFDE